MRRTTGGIAALAGMLAAFAMAAPAWAGTYTVYASSQARLSHWRPAVEHAYTV